VLGFGGWHLRRYMAAGDGPGGRSDLT
jgi:hypothetical protein